MLQVSARGAPLGCRVEVSPLAWCQGDTLMLEGGLPWHLLPNSFPLLLGKGPWCHGNGILPLNKEGANLLRRLCPLPALRLQMCLLRSRCQAFPV